MANISSPLEISNSTAQLAMENDGTSTERTPTRRERPMGVTGSTTEWISLAKLSGPLAITFSTQSILFLASFISVRKFGAAALAGLGLGISVCNVSGACVYVGIATGIDTLCSQAHGAGNDRLLGVAFGRGCLVTSLIAIPIGCLWYHMEAVLLAMGQHQDVAHVSGEFCRAFMWGILPFATLENVKRCLQAQEITTPTMIVSAGGVPVTFLLHYITVNIYGLGVYGAGLALSVTGFLMLTILVIWVKLAKVGARDCWSGAFSMEVFKKLPEYMRLSFPGFAGVFLEWTSFEASIFLAGLLRDRRLDIATQVVLLNGYGVLFPLALSVSTAATIRVGTFLGARIPFLAQRAAYATLKLAVGLSCLVGMALGLGRGYWPVMFGVTQPVFDSIKAIGPLFASVLIVDQMQIICTGILRGMGQQSVQAYAAGLAFWGLGVPLQAYLTLGRNWGVAGLWFGLACAEVPLLLVYLWVILRTDWRVRALDASQRLELHSNTDADWRVCISKASQRLEKHSDTDTDSEVGGSVTDEVLLSCVEFAQAEEILRGGDSKEEEEEEDGLMTKHQVSNEEEGASAGSLSSSGENKVSSRGYGSLGDSVQGGDVEMGTPPRIATEPPGVGMLTLDVDVETCNREESHVTRPAANETSSLLP